MSRAAAAALTRGRQVLGAAIPGEPTPPKRQMSAKGPESYQRCPAQALGKNEGDRGEKSVNVGSLCAC